MVFTYEGGNTAVTRHMSAAAIVLTGLFVSPGYGQPADKAQARPATLDPAAIRREATKLAELRALLADPDPNVRLLTMREFARSGDAVQRQLVIEAGLSSAEAALQEAALRAVLANVQQIVMHVTPLDGKGSDGKEFDNFALTVSSFESETGRVAGQAGNKWSGQLQGNVFSFRGDCCGYSNNMQGSFIWDAEAGEFRGIVNTNGGQASATRKASWRPR